MSENDGIFAADGNNLPAVHEEPKPLYAHETLKQMVRAAFDANAANALECLEDRAYYDGDQLSARTRAVLDDRGQPLVYTNMIAPAIDGVLGIIDSGETDPEATGRNPNAQDAAEVVTKLLRYQADQTDYKRTRKSLSDDYVREGTCAAAVLAHETHHIYYNDFFHDPMTRDLDFLDARYMGINKWLEGDEVEAMWPEAYKRMGRPTGGNLLSSQSEIDAAKFWFDPKRNRLRVCEMYYRVGFEWHYAVFCDRGVFEAGPSPYEDDEGHTICPIVALSWKINGKGERYGAIRHARPLQDEINARRSRLLHLVNHRQVRQTEQMAPAANAAIAKKEAAKADGVIPYGYEAVPAPDLAQGQMLILQRSMQDLERMFPTPAVLGRVSSNAESGRARQVLQQAGYTELARSLGRFQAMEHRIFKQMWFRCKQFMHDPQIIPVVGDSRAPQFLMVNEPVIVHQVDPMSRQLVAVDSGKKKQHLAKMDVEIIINSTPDTVSLKQETFEILSNTLQSTRMDILSPQFRAYLKFVPLPNTRDIIEQLEQEEQKAAEANQQQMQLQADMQQAALAGQQAKASKDEASAEKHAAQAEKTNIENAVAKLQIGAAASMLTPPQASPDQQQFLSLPPQQ